MKKRIYLLLAMFSVALVSCEEYLEVNPNMGMTAEEVYSDYDNMRVAVDYGYVMVRSYTNRANFWAGVPIGSLSDEMQIANPTNAGMGTKANRGLWQDFNDYNFGFAGTGDPNKVDEFEWASSTTTQSIYAIRALNLCEEGYEKYKDVMSFPEEASYTEAEMRDQILGQICFLRAHHYFEIIRRYGPMPDMRKAFDPSPVAMDVERPTYQQSTEYLVADLDRAIELLPEKWASSNDALRATKTTAAALKAWALLYSASPLMNSEYPYTVNKGYNPEELKKAVDASIQAISYYESGKTRYRMYDWADIWLVAVPKGSEQCDEAIWQPPMAKNNASGNWPGTGAGWYSYQNTHSNNGSTVLWPTYNSVCWFETASGYAIEDVLKDPSLDQAWYDAYQNDPISQFDNRDPRLKQFIFCQDDDIFSSWANYPLNMTQGSDLRKDIENSKGYVSTGFMLAKWFWPGQHASTKFSKMTKNPSGINAQQYQTCLAFIRVPQLYLDFAEAANELYGPTGTVTGTEGISVKSAVDAINKVRRRVGGVVVGRYAPGQKITDPQMPDVRDMYLTDTETFRKRIYNERAVEFYNEFQRWFDIRRWLLAEELFADSENCIKKFDMWVENGKVVGEAKPVDPSVVRVFEPKHYWYPFTSGDMKKVMVFKQNPGW